MNITIIGVPYDLDQPYVGKGKAPDALLDRGLAGRLGDLGYTTVLAEMIDLPETDEPVVARIGRLMAKVGYEVARSRAAGFFPLIVGGDCMVALGAVSGLLDPLNTAVAWIDAHGDFNTPQTTISGYLGGMPLACIVGRGLEDLREQCKLATPVPEGNVALIGARDLDPAEEQLLLNSSVTLVRGAELRDTDMLDRVLQRLGSLPQLYLHVDIDVLDPLEAPGIDYPAAGGLRLAELTQVVERIAGLGNLAALSLTAVNPEKDNDQRTVSAGLAAIEAALRPGIGMRVITGSAKGHHLKAPKGMGTRPMLDRLKEALFSVLEGYGPIRGRVLDLYAGTGSLGIECLSRGAAWADFVEQRGHVCRIIAENLEHTRLQERGRVHQMPVGRYLATAHPEEKYAIILMDPPYADPVIEDTIRAVGASELLADEGLLIVGHSPRVTLADSYESLRRRKFRRLGDSCFSIYEIAAGSAMQEAQDGP